MKFVKIMFSQVSVCPHGGAYLVGEKATATDGTHPIRKHSCSSLLLLNIVLVLIETNTDVHMYIEEFILVEIWIHLK